MSDTNPFADGSVFDDQVVVRDGGIYDESDIEDNVGEERTADDIDPALGAEFLDPGKDFVTEPSEFGEVDL